MVVKVLVIPLVNRYWLLHGWRQALHKEGPPKAWQLGSSSKEKAQLLFANAKYKVRTPEANPFLKVAFTAFPHAQ